MNTAITFHIEPYTLDARRPWFEQFASEGPYRLRLFVKTRCPLLAYSVEKLGFASGAKTPEEFCSILCAAGNAG